MTALPAGLAPATYTIDASHTQAGFTVRHAGISKVRGTVPVTEGTIVIGETSRAPPSPCSTRPP